MSYNYELSIVPKSVTLNDFERRKWPLFCVISPNSVAFAAQCIKVGSMGVGAGLYMYDVVVEKFTFAISSPDEFL